MNYCELEESKHVHVYSESGSSSSGSGSDSSPENVEPEASVENGSANEDSVQSHVPSPQEYVPSNRGSDSSREVSQLFVNEK